MRQMVHSVTGSSRVYIFDSFQKKREKEREEGREKRMRVRPSAICLWIENEMLVAKYSFKSIVSLACFI